MFTAKTIEKSFFNGDLKITVEYNNGTQKWNETYNISSEADLNNKIENRLNVLNGLQELSAKYTLGAWTAPVKEAPVIDPIQEALNNVYRAKEKLSAKLITEAEYDAVVAVYKGLVGGK